MTPTAFKLTFNDATTVNFTAVAFSIDDMSCSITTTSPVYALALKTPEIFNGHNYKYVVDLVQVKSLSIK